MLFRSPLGTGFTVPDSFPEMSQGDIETATIFTRAMRKIQSKFSGLVSDIGGKAAIAGQTFTGDIAAPTITATQQFISPLKIGPGSNVNSSILISGQRAVLEYDTASGSAGGIKLGGAGKILVLNDFGDNVGIGTTTPSSALDVVGGISSTDMPKVGGDPIVESGSNSNGQYTKFSDGTLVCTSNGETTFAYDTADQLSYSWTYPAAFSTALPAVSWALAGRGAITGAESIVQEINIISSTPSLGVLRFWSSGGTGPFSPGDSCTGLLTAIGRWF